MAKAFTQQIKSSCLKFDRGWQRTTGRFLPFRVTIGSVGFIISLPCGFYQVSSQSFTEFFRVNILETEIAKNYLPDGISWWRQVKAGYWLYDKSVWFPMFIIEANWDYYTIDNLQADYHWTESPDLNEDGVLFYVAWNQYKITDSGYLDWGMNPSPHNSISECMDYVLSVMQEPDNIAWDAE